jgi:hypothetical protein
VKPSDRASIPEEAPHASASGWALNRFLRASPLLLGTVGLTWLNIRSIERMIIHFALKSQSPLYDEEKERPTSCSP